VFLYLIATSLIAFLSRKASSLFNEFGPITNAVYLFAFTIGNAPMELHHLTCRLFEL
jgi:hypothetical protein